MSAEKGDRATEVLLLFMETLDQVGISFEIIGFSDAPSVHRQFNGGMSASEKEDMIDEVSRYMGNGATADADALKLAVDNMKKQFGERRVILLLTDGEGNINTTGQSMDEIIGDAEDNGIEVIGIGIGEGMKYVKEVYPNNIVVPEIDDLPVEVAAILEHRILGEKIDREKPAYFGLQSFDMIGASGDVDDGLKGYVENDAARTIKEVMEQLNKIDMTLIPVVPEGKKLWHVIDEELIPHAIRNDFRKLVKDMNKLPRVREKIRVVTGRQDIAAVAAELAADSANIVGVAVTSEDILNALPKNVKALVFKGEPGDFRQIEGIIAALRALHGNNIPDLIAVYEILTGNRFNGDIKALLAANDPKTLAEAIIFNLKPIEIHDPAILREINEKLLNFLRAA